MRGKWSSVVLAGGVVFAAVAFFSLSGTAQNETPQQSQSQTQAQGPSGAQSPALQTGEQVGESLKKRQAEERKKDKELYKELDNPYKNFLSDVSYIISPEERSAFLHLQTNEARDQFIEAFWDRRNPPDEAPGTYKLDYYDRIAYANEHYASGIPGWKTDRGRIYIMWGKPDEVDSHPSGGTYERPAAEGGGTTTTYPFEDWRYRYLPGIGENVELEFVDPSGSGEYHLTMDPSEKDALLYVPGAGLTDLEAMGLSSKTARFQNTDGTHDAQPIGALPESMDEFTRLENYAKIWQPPPVEMKDLEGDVESRLIPERNQLHFQYEWAFLRLTSDTVLVPITIQVPRRQLNFKESDGVATATMDIYGRITTVSGRRVQEFAQTVNARLPASILQRSMAGAEIYEKSLPLNSGLYKLDIVIKDKNSGNVGVVNTAVPVPRFQDGQLSSSTVILADEIQRVSSHDIGQGQFVLGDVKVRPKLGGAFAQNDAMKIYLQVYNLKVDDKTHQSDPIVEFRVINEKGGRMQAFELQKSQIPDRGEELTLEDSLALASFPPGKYKLEVAVTDNLTKQVITPSAQFTIRPAAGARPVQSAQQAGSAGSN